MAACTSFRAALELLEKDGSLIRITKEVDPIYEISGLQKKLEHSHPIVFEKIKGYPGTRNAANLFSRKENVCRILGLDDYAKLKFRCLAAMKNPVRGEIVSQAPSQEVVTTDAIDMLSIMPIIKHTELDAGRIVGGGITLLSGKYFKDGTHLSFNRIHFRGKDWASVHSVGGTHLGDAIRKFKNERVPVTVNIGTSPSVAMVAGASFPHLLVEPGADEVGMAGALQGEPVKLVKAKTVDAYAVADAEWVIEGYFEGTAWESDEAEKIGTPGVAPFFPEWPGYMGRAQKSMKLNVTAVTRRADNPYYYTPLAHSYEMSLSLPFREASLFEIADRLFPGLVKDVNILPMVAGWGGNIIFKIRKRGSYDDGYVRALLSSILSTTQHIRLVVVCDEDADITTSDGVLWAITTRCDPATDIILGGGGLGQIAQPGSRGLQIAPQVPLVGGMGFDATVKFADKDNFIRPKYPVGQIRLADYLDKETIERVQTLQSEYAKILSEQGW